MEPKAAVVLDTNFIITHKSRMPEMLERLSEHYVVYVTEISIEERLSQMYIELEEQYKALETLKSKHAKLADVSIKKPFDVKVAAQRESVNRVYQTFFGDHIIPFVPDAATLKTIMDRVFTKAPPFRRSKDASDKGFKDTLLWFSLLAYFRANGEEKIIFVTDDQGFSNATDDLCSEFNEHTGKTIEIKPNSFNNNIIGRGEEETPPALPPIANLVALREKVQDTLESLCFTEVVCDNFGNTYIEQTLTIHEHVTENDMKTLFEKLQEIIDRNLFERNLPASVAFAVNVNIEDGVSISIDALQEAQSLYAEISSKHNAFLPQFYSAAANVFNRTYKAPEFEAIDADDDLPF